MTDSVVIFEAAPLKGFVETPRIAELARRCLTYLRCGFPVHLEGRSGTGKTSLALHVASKLGRPVVLVFGCDEYDVSDLVGGAFGFRQRTVVDEYIHSVHKTEVEAVTRWVDERLTTACRYGYTLVYDEFTRSRPETNNVLLSVLEEKVLDTRSGGGSRTYLSVNPDFSAIFTSNPEEYAGVHKSQDALRDRMITLNLDEMDYDTEVAITRARSGASPDDAARIVRIVRAVRARADLGLRPTVRACIMMARAVRESRARVSPDDEVFMAMCLDILASSGPRGMAGRARAGGIAHCVRESLASPSDTT